MGIDHREARLMKVEYGWGVGLLALPCHMEIFYHPQHPGVSVSPGHLMPLRGEGMKLSCERVLHGPVCQLVFDPLMLMQSELRLTWTEQTKRPSTDVLGSNALQRPCRAVDLICTKEALF